ncbi:transposase, partial [Candidatus Entotheonella serta]
MGTAYLGQMPEAGQGTLTDQMSTLLKAILIQVDSQSLRLASVTDEGYHPSGYYHQVLKNMVDPRRPWRR